MTSQRGGGPFLILSSLTLVAACASPPTVQSMPTGPSRVLPLRSDSSPPQERPDGSGSRNARVVPAASNPWELLIAGTGGNDEEFEAGSAAGIGSLGYYLNDVVELSVRQNVAYGNAGPGSSEVWNLASRAAIDLHFPLGAFVPYVGANFGYVYGDTVDDSLVAGPEVGAKFYLQNDAFLMIGAEYEFFFDKGDSLSTAFERGQFLYTLGMGMRF